LEATAGFDALNSSLDRSLDARWARLRRPALATSTGRDEADTPALRQRIAQNRRDQVDLSMGCNSIFDTSIDTRLKKSGCRSASKLVVVNIVTFHASNGANSMALTSQRTKETTAPVNFFGHTPSQKGGVMTKPIDSMTTCIPQRRCAVRSCSQALLSGGKDLLIALRSSPFAKTFRTCQVKKLSLQITKFALFKLLAFSVLAMNAGCASRFDFPLAPESSLIDNYTYKIGAGDSLNIIVWRNPELSMTVPVRPDGKVAAPLVEEILAEGKTSIELARDVEKELGKYVRDPVVTVLVTAFFGPYTQQIRVVGEATRPQFLNYKTKMTLLDVMIAVGGLTDFAAGNRATILRTGDGSKQYAVRVRDLIKRGDLSANIEMMPGDILVIPQSLF